MIEKTRHKPGSAAAAGKTTGGKKTPATATARHKTPGKAPAKKKPAATSDAPAAKKKAPAAKKAPPAAKKSRAANARMTAHHEPPAGIAPYEKRKGEEYMNHKQLDHFRMILTGWKKSLMQEVDRTVTHMKSDSSNHADSADRATQEEGFSLELRERDRERKLIRKIDQAITRLDNNEFGYCKLCGVEIGIRRLEARPTATMCIDCKTFDEIKEKQIASA